MPDLQRDLIQNLQGGASVETALASLGIPRETFDEWMTTPYAQEVEQAQAKARSFAEVRLLKDKPEQWLKQRPLGPKRQIVDLPADGICTAKNRQGTRCKNRALKGTSVCRRHGGLAPQVQRVAGQRIALGRIGRLMQELERPEPDPIDALMGCMYEAAWWCESLKRDIGELDESHGVNHTGDGKPHVLVTMLKEWTELQARFAKMALDAGVEERKVQLAEAQGQMIAAVITQLLDDPAFGLDQAQRTIGRKLAARHLKALPSAG